jgi:hypothetical protein
MGYFAAERRNNLIYENLFHIPISLFLQETTPGRIPEIDFFAREPLKKEFKLKTVSLKKIQSNPKERKIIHMQP